jgi:hypothetical protein
MNGLVTGVNYSNSEITYRAFETDELFSEKYQAKTASGSSFLQCVFCGRDTSKQGKSNGVVVGQGGSLIVHPEDYEQAQDGGFHGLVSSWLRMYQASASGVPSTESIR